MEQVNTITLRLLRNSEYCALIANLKFLLPGVLPSNPITDDLLAQFDITYEKLDLVNRVDSGTVLTEKIQVADLERGDTWRGMDLIVDAYLHSPVPAQVESAKIIRRVFDLYGDFRKRSYDAESSDADNLVQDLEKPVNVEHCNKIKLSPWIPLYKIKLEAFKSMQNQRDTEKGYKSSGDVKAVRVEMDPIYREIINKVNAYVTIGMVTPELENFIILMNQKIKRYNDLLAARQGRRNGGEGTPESPSQDD